jgi:hypothetical protein
MGIGRGTSHKRETTGDDGGRVSQLSPARKGSVIEKIGH